MNQSNSLLILLLFSVFSGFTQTSITINGRVVDTTGTGLAYVNIGISGTARGTVSNEDGRYSLYLSEPPGANDSIAFSRVGYRKESLQIAELINSEVGIVTLQSYAAPLPTVMVQSGFDEFKEVGNHNTDANRAVNFSIGKHPRQNLGAEIGRKFNLPGKTNKIEKLRFYVSQNNFEEVSFRINFYQLNKGKPGERLLNENVILAVSDKGTGWLEVDLSEYNLIAKKSIIASVEWVDHSAKGTRLSLPISIPSVGAVHYYKFGSQNNWRKFPLMSSCMTLVVSY